MLYKIVGIPAENATEHHTDISGPLRMEPMLGKRRYSYVPVTNMAFFA
jgi:hypothetical protein